MKRERDLSFDLDKFFKFRKVDEKLFHSTLIIWNFWFAITLKRVIFAGSGGAWPNFPGKWDNSSYSSDDVFSFSLSHQINFDKKNVQSKEITLLCHDIRSSVFAISGQISPGHVTSGDYYFWLSLSSLLLLLLLLFLFLLLLLLLLLIKLMILMISWCCTYTYFVK